MKRRRKTTSVSYELKKAVILLERCDASDRPVSKVAPSVLKPLPHVDIVDYSKIQEDWTPNQHSHPPAHKCHIKKKKPVTKKLNQKNKNRCDRKIIINEKSSPDILTSEVSCTAISVVKAGSLDISAIGRCLLEASVEELPAAEPDKEGSAAPETCHEVSAITASCLGELKAEISIKDEMLTGYTEEIETTKDDATLMETVEEKDLITNSTCTNNEFKIESIPDGIVGFVNCGVVDSEMSLLVSEDVEKMAVTEEDSTTDPSAADSLYPFDEMPLLSIEGDCTCLVNLDHCPPNNLVNGEQMESFFVPDRASDLFLCENPLAVFTNLNSDVMLGDIGNRLSLFEEEVELLAVSDGKSMETAAQETVDFGDSGFAVDELDWNCEQTWPLLDSMGDSIQNDQGLLNNSLDAKDSDDEFRHKITEEVFAQHLSSLHCEDQEKMNLRSGSPRHLDSLVDSAVVEDNIVVASDKKFDANKSDAFPQNMKQRGGEHQEGTAVEVSLDGDHQQKSFLPMIKEKEVTFAEDDQREFKMKPLMNFSLTSSDKSLKRDFTEEKSLQRKPVTTSTDIKKCQDKSIWSKTLLKDCEATKLKYSEVRKRKEIDAVGEMQKKILRVTAVKSSFQNEHRLATAKHNSISCDEKRFIHCIHESLEADDQSFVNPNASKTGNLLEDPLVSTKSSLQTSLHCCPTLEVLQPENSSQNSKEKLSVKLKTSSFSDQQQPLSREGVLDAELDSVTQKNQKKDELDIRVNHRVLEAESDCFSSAIQKAQRLKTDLEILRNKIRSDLCNLLLARLGNKMPSVKVTNMAFDIESELWSVSKHLSSIYKQRASSLMRILRRSSSQRLCDRLLSSEVKPHHLVQNMTRYLHNAIMLKGTEKESIMSHSDVLPEITLTSDQHELQTHDVDYHNCAGRMVVNCSLEPSQEQMPQRPSNAKMPKRPEEPDKEKQQSVIVGVGKNSFQRLTPPGRSCEAVQLPLRREMSLETTAAETVPHLNNVHSSSCMSPHFVSPLPSTAPDEDMSNASSSSSSSSLLQSALSFGLTVTEEAHGPLICLVNIGSVMNSFPDVIVDNVALGSSKGSHCPPDEPQQRRLSNASDEECCLSGVDERPAISADQSSSSSVNARAVHDDGFKAVPHIISKYSEECQKPTMCSNENGLSSPCETEFLQNGITQEVTIRRGLKKRVESLESIEATSFLLLSSNDSSTSLEISGSVSSSSLKPDTHSACKQTTADESASIKPDIESNRLDSSTDALHEVKNICGSDSEADLRNISVTEADTCTFKSASEMNVLDTEEKLLPLTTGILVELNGLESSIMTNTDIFIENSMALDKCQRNTVNSGKNNLSFKLDECRDNTAKEFCDPESYSELVSDDNAPVSHEATHSKDCQEDLVSNTLNIPSIVSFDAVNSSGDAKEMKCAISDLCPVTVLDEDSCQAFSDNVMDLCGAHTTLRQEKVLVEVDKPAEKVSDIEKEETGCKSESSAGAQCDGLLLDLDQGFLNKNECVLKPMQLDNAESLQRDNSGCVDLLERHHSRADDSTVSAAECGPLDSEDFSNQVCLPSLQKELIKSSQYKQTVGNQLSYLNGQDQTLRLCTVVKRLQGTAGRRDVAASLSASCARAALVQSEIPSYVAKTNTESILPVVCDSSAETLTTVGMPTKPVVSSTLASVCSVPNPSQLLPPLYSISEFSCASSASLISSSTGCSSVRSSSVLFGCNQIQNHSLLLPKDIRHSRLPPGPRSPLLLSGTRFLATVPQQLSQQRARNELFPIRSRDSFCKSHSQSNIMPHPKSPLSPVAVRNPRLPCLENQTSWQSRGHHKEYDDAFACKTFHSRGNNMRSHFLDFSHRMAVRPSLESQSLQQFRQPLIELKIRPFAKKNDFSKRPRSRQQRMTANSDAYHSAMDNTVDRSVNRHLISNSEGQNHAGQPAANSFSIVHEDSEFPQPDNSAVSNHTNLFNSTYIEENYSGNSYEYFGSSEENLEKFLPHFIPMSAIDYLDKSTDGDNQQVNEELCSQLGFDAERNDFADTADKNKILLQPSDNTFFNNRELRQNRRSESANESFGRTMTDVDQRLSNHEINSLTNEFGLYCPLSLRVPDCSFSKTESRFRSFDGSGEIASIGSDAFNGSDQCQFRDQLSIAGHPHRSRRYAEDMELPFLRDSFHFHRRNYGREMSSNQVEVDSPFANSQGSCTHEPLDRNQQRRETEEQHRDFASGNAFYLSQAQLREDDCTSGGRETDEPSGNLTRPALLQNLSSNCQRQNVSRDFKRRRLEDRSCDVRWIHHHGLNKRVADKETPDLISCSSYNSEQVHGYRHGQFFRPESHQSADLQQSSFHNSNGDNRIEPWTCRSTRRHLLDYELRTSECMKAQVPQEMSDIRHRLCDIDEGHKGSCASNTYQHCSPFGIHEFQTGSEGRISYDVAEANMLFGFSSGTCGSVLDEGLKQEKEMVHQLNSSDESKYLSSDGFTSREKKLSLNRGQKLHRNYEHFGQYDGNRSLFHSELSGSCRVSRTKDDESQRRRGDVRVRNRYDH